jgi:hypothetical protein
MKKDTWEAYLIDMLMNTTSYSHKATTPTSSFSSSFPCFCCCCKCACWCVGALHQVSSTILALFQTLSNLWNRGPCWRSRPSTPHARACLPKSSLRCYISLYKAKRASRPLPHRDPGALRFAFFHSELSPSSLYVRRRPQQQGCRALSLSV